MKEITQERVKELFTLKVDGLYWKKSKTGRHGEKAGYKGKYREIRIGNILYFEHRLIYLWHHGWIPNQLDHKDGNGINNSIDNLRPATQTQNMGNARKRERTSSIYKGVCFYKALRKWHAYININYKRTHLGYFENEMDAAKAYNRAAVDKFGEYARLNTIN